VAGAAKSSLYAATYRNMRINLDKIETTDKINGLGLKRTIDSKQYKELYLDTDLGCYVVVRKDSDSPDSKYSGRIFVERSSVACAQISRDSVPKHQPIGTPDELDTPSGTKRKSRTQATSKKALTEKIAARKAAKAE